ncbi:unnamed protein product [marine sediment metagenome]|uniref:Uncharacterized protein n=1 Tax=marine sediment metagenome TaxID=412755 RepID=X1VWZ0_9ZZZZ
MGRTKTIKLSVDEYNNLKLARQKLIEYGLISLPKPLRLQLSDFLKDEKLTLGKMVGVVAHTLSYVLTLTNKRD